ncbi:MAG: RNA 2',3'-cyclic phosphodiesterase [archaeon]
MRAFISIELSEEAKKEAERVGKLIWEKDIVRGRFVKGENLHLTLKFLGELTDLEVEKTKKALSGLKLKKFKVRLKDAGFFSPTFVKVLWVGLEGEGVFKLQEQIDNLLKDIFPKEKSFVSHITIARVKKILDKEKFMKFFNELKVEEVEFDVSEVKLKKSELSKEGPVYENVLEVKLK